MPILRIKKRDNPFVMIDKRPINDERLSWKAKGILVYLLSKPDDWKVWIKDLVKRAHDGKASVRSGIQELMDAGYIDRCQLRTAENRWGEVEYTVREVPLTGFQQAGNQEPGKQQTGNRTYTKNDLTNSELREDSPADAGGPPSKPVNQPVVKASKNGTPPAVKVFRENAHRYPAKSWYSKVAEVVGESDKDLEYWGVVVHAYVGLGWNPTNVKGMLDFYQRNEIPSSKPKHKGALPRGRPTREAPTGETYITGKYSESIQR